MIFGMEGTCWMGGFLLMLAIVGSVVGFVGLVFAMVFSFAWVVGRGIPTVVEKTMPPVHEFFSYGGKGRTIGVWIGRIVLTVGILVGLTGGLYMAARSYCHHGRNFGKAYGSIFESEDTKPGKGK